MAELAAAQHGNVTRRQLLAVGLTRHAIRHRLARHRMYRVHPGVYSVGHRPVTWLQRAAAAVLACGPTAVLSHRSALALWDLARWETPFHVTVTRGAAALRPQAETAGRPTRSGWEDAFPSFCARYGLPRPRLNALVCGLEVDALFEAERVIVELDGWEFHSDRAAFERDRARDAVTTAAGYITLRITQARMDESPDAEAKRLGRLLTLRRHRGV